MCGIGALFVQFTMPGLKSAVLGFCFSQRRKVRKREAFSFTKGPRRFANISFFSRKGAKFANGRRLVSREGRRGTQSALCELCAFARVSYSQFAELNLMLIRICG